VMEMQARHGEGAAWVETGAAHLGGATNFRFHLAWHRALFLLEGGARAEMLACYDESVRDHASPLVQGQPDLYIDVQNAASLLMRLELLGVDVGDRWSELADKAAARIGDHLIPFTVPHWVMALAATGRWSDCDAVLAALREACARTASGGDAPSAARVALATAEGVHAHRRGAHAAAVAALVPVRHDLARLGGSHAQRDILWQIMTDAARRLGDADLTRQLVAEVRAARAPHAIPVFYRDISLSAGPSDI